MIIAADEMKFAPAGTTPTEPARNQTNEQGGLERGHQRTLLAADARRWSQWVFLQSGRLKRRLS